MRGRTSRQDPPRRRALWTAAAGVAGAVMLTLGLASPAKAASVSPIPVASGPWGCNTMAAYFGEAPGTWKEIRFTHEPGQASIRPGVLTKTSQGNTITVTLTSEGTVDFTSKLPIEAVYVNKGTNPNGAHAFYRYIPAVASDTRLGLKPIVLSGVDHVVLCWKPPVAPTTTTTTSTTTTTTMVQPTSVAPPTTEVVLPTSVAPTTTTAVVLPTSVAQTTVAGTLPETGGSATSTLAAAAILLLAGVAASAVVLVRRSES